MTANCYQLLSSVCYHEKIKLNQNYIKLNQIKSKLHQIISTLLSSLQHSTQRYYSPPHHTVLYCISFYFIIHCHSLSLLSCILYFILFTPLSSLLLSSLLFPSPLLLPCLPLHLSSPHNSTVNVQYAWISLPGKVSVETILARVRSSDVLTPFSPSP